MFEKEAKEEAEKLEEKQTLGVYDNDEDLARDEGFNDGKVYGYEEGFKDGAEFGYNFAKEEMDYLNKHWGSKEERKADEWHEVEKGDLPKSSKSSVIGILKDGNLEIGHSLIECYYSKEDGWSDCYGNSLYHEVEYWTESNFPKRRRVNK